MIIRLAAALVALAAAAPAGAATPVPLAKFKAISLVGGGEVHLRHGPEQKVTLLRGDLDLTRFEVKKGNLEIRACVRSCHDYDLAIEIVTPDIDALAITGGGTIEAEGAFPARDGLAASVRGGGVIDAEAIRARSVAASIRGGGVIETDPRETLVASVQGGGNVRYRGDPQKTVSINGGGDVTRTD